MNSKLKLPKDLMKLIEVPNIDPDYINQETVEDELSVSDLREHCNILTADYINYEDIHETLS